jgi:hypothetical protein
MMSPRETKKFAAWAPRSLRRARTSNGDVNQSVRGQCVLHYSCILSAVSSFLIVDSGFREKCLFALNCGDEQE